jgi:hypothetical protein
VGDPVGPGDCGPDWRRPAPPGRSPGARPVRPRPRPEHAALVLRPQRGGAAGRRAAPRARWRHDRRRGHHRAAAARSGFVPLGAAGLAADSAEPQRRVQDG